MGTPKKCSLTGYFKEKGKKLRDNFDIANGFNRFFSTIGSNLDNDLKKGNKCFKSSLPI